MIKSLTGTNLSRTSNPIRTLGRRIIGVTMIMLKMLKSLLKVGTINIKIIIGTRTR